MTLFISSLVVGSVVIGAKRIIAKRARGPRGSRGTVKGDVVRMDYTPVPIRSFAPTYIRDRDER